MTRKSGLELNADKTEILRIGHLNEQEVLLSINYMGIAHKIRNVDQMKICGLYFCNDPVVEYDHNILCKTRWGYPCLAWVDQPAPPPPH